MLSVCIVKVLLFGDGCLRKVVDCNTFHKHKVKKGIGIDMDDYTEEEKSV